MEDTLELQQVICPSCKQVISSFSPFAAVVECPYCHNKAFNPLITAKKVPVPERLIVFKTDEQIFENRLVDELIDRDYVPRNIFQCINPGSVIKAYLPMFLYEGRYQSSWSCKALVLEKQKDQSGEIKSTEKYVPTTGTSQGNFAFLCLAYDGKDIPEELRDFCKQFAYNVQASQEYDPALLGLDSGQSPMTLAMDADTDIVWSKYGRALVDELADENAKNQLANQSIKDFNASTSYDRKHKGRYVLAPFWFVYYTYNNEKFYYIMDGLGEKTSMTVPSDPEEIKFVDNKKKVDRIVTLCVFLAIPLLFVKFYIALIYFGVWLIVDIIVGRSVNKQIRKHLEESREARRAAAKASHLQ